MLNIKAVDTEEDHMILTCIELEGFRATLQDAGIDVKMVDKHKSLILSYYLACANVAEWAKIMKLPETAIC